MKKYNKLEKTFGNKAYAGQILFFALLFTLFYGLISEEANIFSEYTTNGVKPTIICILFFLFVAFIGFSTTYTKIDYTNKRIKYATKLCGIIPVGKWTYLASDMKLGLKESTEQSVVYNRASYSPKHTSLKIMLYDSEGYELIPIKKIKKAKLAEEELEKLSEMLGVGVIE